MRRARGGAVAAGVGLWAAAAVAGPLPRSTPEAQGIPSGAISAFVTAADQKIDALHSVMIVRHGKVVAEGWWAPFAADTRHSLYSLTKSFTSTAVGLAVSEGRMSVDDKVLPYFPDEAPAEPSDNLKAMRVRDLLSMSTGQHAEAQLGPDVVWTKAFLEQPVVHKPGTFFLYNTPGSYMLSAIVQKATGSTVLDYLRPRLFEPLGIEDPVWPASPQGVTIGGYGLSLRTEDIARFGQLVLRKGDWNGRRLVPAAWFEAATSRQVSNGSNPDSDWEQGYGYQFWRCRHGAFRGDGAFGQFCVILPDKDAVVAITSGVKDMQSVLNLVWEHLLPAMQTAPLRPDPAANKALKGLVARLALPTLRADSPATPPTPWPGRVYRFPANDQKLETLALEPGEGGAATLVVRFNGSSEQRVPCGRDEWRKGRLAIGTLPEQPVAASGLWIAPDTYSARLIFYETPFALTVKLRFAGDELVHEAEYNVAFGPTQQPPLTGKAE